MNTDIKLQNVCLDYPVYGVSQLSFKRRLLNVATGGIVKMDDKKIIVRALDDLSFTLTHGDRLALLGHNGAGKSSLLRVLAGIYQPTSGYIETQGTISSLLDLSFGMEPYANAYQNIKIRCMLAGLSEKEIQEVIADVEEFTELGDFLAMPIKTYSSGMAMRLAFALSTAVKPEILLIDEAIGVGDQFFKAKAKKRLEAFIDSAHILVLTSHDNKILTEFCNKGLWLEHGKIKMLANVDKVVSAYQATV